MIIAIDYDGTFSLDPRFWGEFANLARWAGHQVIGITGNPSAVEDPAYFKACSGATYFVPAGVPKEKIARQAGLRVHVWIDDEPQWISEHPGCLQWDEQA